jgi:signal peptidase II
MIEKFFGLRLNMRATLLVVFLVYLFDQVSKYFARQHLSLSDAIPITPFFNLVYVENIGSAFGMLQGTSVFFFIAVTVIAIVLISILMIRDTENRLAYGFILSGALGNLTDRIRYGAVIDFFDFYVGSFHWPAFNIADVALCCGIGLLLIHAFFIERTKKTDKI